MDKLELLALIESLGIQDASKADFELSVEKSKEIKNLTNDQKLQLYGLYKQSTEGNIITKRPWSIEVVACAKWDSWKCYEHWSCEKARTAYCYLIAEYLAQLNSNSSSINEGFGASVSTLSSSMCDIQWGNHEFIFHLLNDNNINELKMFIENHRNDLFIKSSTGLYPIHYAADRGLLKCLDILLSNGADINAQDDSGLTATMYAAICDNNVVLEYLIARGADLSIKDNYQSTIFELEEISPRIKELLCKSSII